MTCKITFIFNNKKGFQSTNKRLKLIKYFKDKIVSNSFLFLQETHSTVNDEIKWKDEFKGEVLYSHGKSNTCGVLTSFIGSRKLFIKNKLSENDGHILIYDVDIDDENSILINLYNHNTEVEQLKTLANQTEMLTKFHLAQNNNTICAEDFNLLFNVKIESYGGNPVFEKRFVGKIFELKETYNLKDIWRIRNPKTKQYTFRQKHVSGFLQRPLYYFFISNNIQEFILDIDIIPAISSDHSSILISLSKKKNKITKVQSFGSLIIRYCLITFLRKS